MFFLSIFLPVFLCCIPVAILITKKYRLSKSSIGLIIYASSITLILTVITLMILILISFAGPFMPVVVLLSLLIMMIAVLILNKYFKLNNKAFKYSLGLIFGIVISTVCVKSFWPVTEYCKEESETKLSPDGKYKGVLCYSEYSGKGFGVHIPGAGPSAGLYAIKLYDTKNNDLLYKTVVTIPKQGSDNTNFTWEWNCDKNICNSATYSLFYKNETIDLPTKYWSEIRAKVNLW